MITLYHGNNTRSVRCLWLLEELGLDYKLEVVDFPPRVKAPEFMKINKLGTLPFLVDGDTKMSESCAILDYLSHRFGEGRFAVAVSDPAYGDYLNWLHFGESSLAAIQAVALRYRYFLPKEQRNVAVAEDFEEQVIGKLSALEKALEGKEFLCGDALTNADISVGYALHLSGLFGMVERFPAGVAAYFQKLTQRAAFQKAIAT